MTSLAPPSPDVAGAWFAESLARAAAAPPSDELQVALVERSARTGSMAPLHRRDEPETYCVLEGHVTFYVGAETVAAGPGDVVVAPSGVARTFRVDSPRARWSVLTRVRSLARFADFTRAVHATPPPSGRWPSAHEHAAVASIAAANGIELLGPPGALPA